VGFLPLAPAAKAAELVGLTRDAVSENGISSVKVRLFTTGTTLYRNAISDGSGKYRIVDIEPGRYVVSFEKTGFSISPKAAMVDLGEKDTKEENATLYQENPDAAYIASLADKIKESAHQCPSVVSGYKNEWRTIEYSEVSTEFKDRLANELKRQDAEAIKVDAIKNLANDDNHLEFKPPEKNLQKSSQDTPKSLEIVVPSDSKGNSTDVNHLEFKPPEKNPQKSIHDTPAPLNTGVPANTGGNGLDTDTDMDWPWT